MCIRNISRFRLQLRRKAFYRQSSGKMAIFSTSTLTKLCLPWSVPIEPTQAHWQYSWSMEWQVALCTSSKKQMWVRVCSTEYALSSLSNFSHWALCEETLKLAHIIANKSSNTIKIAKATVRAAFENTLKKGIKIEAEAFANIFDTKDAQIGVSAFIERKQPEWQHE